MGHRSWITPLENQQDFETAQKILEAIRSSRVRWDIEATEGLSKEERQVRFELAEKKCPRSWAV